MDSAFEKLIIRYADGQKICNCGQAYYKNCGTSCRDGITTHDNPTCEYGCSANQINAREYVAKRVTEELRMLGCM